MSSEIFLKDLFDAHLIDLNDVQSTTTNQRILCPICLESHGEESIKSQRLTDGHVWLKEILNKSDRKTTIRHRVLLCDRCNHTAGARGDAQMQILKKVREGEQTGNLYAQRKIQILRKSSKFELLESQAYIRISDADNVSGQISFPLDKKTSTWKADPAHAQKIKELFKSGERFSLIVYPPHNINPELAKIGWITSSYLFAFYTFGYRYILHKNLEPIRELIKTSFEKREEGTDGLQDVEVISCNSHYSERPNIYISVPSDSNKNVNLQIDILNYHIQLPFHFEPIVFGSLIEARSQNPLTRWKMARAIKSDNKILIKANCTKMRPHDCIWDYVLGKPIPGYSDSRNSR